MVDGVVRPLLLDDDQQEIWKVEGIEHYCGAATLIKPEWGKVTLERPLGDAHSRLTLELTNGCKITYDERFHGI